jgi:hypothetical protein
VADARVFYASSGMGMGLGFTRIEPERLKVLELWLAELSGEAPREVKALQFEDHPLEGNQASTGNEQRYVLNELIVTLIRKLVLTDAEGKALLQKLMR